MSLSDKGKSLKTYYPLGVNAPAEIVVSAMNLDVEKTEVAQRLQRKLETFIHELSADELELFNELFV